MTFLRLPASFLLCVALLLPSALAQTTAVDVYVFWREGCPHCERELAFLRGLQSRDLDVRLHALEVGRDVGHRLALTEVARRLRAERVAVPFTVIGERHLIGYNDDASTGAQIEALVQACRAGPCPDLVAAALSAAHHASRPANGPDPAAASSAPDTVRAPMLGDIALRGLSLPALTVVLGAVDGFNPCAMWTLVFLIGLLVGMRDKMRMWVLGAAFIAASAAVYFVFMAAWLNLLLFLGMLLWIRLAVGAVAIAGGAYYLREYWVNRDGVCKVTGQARRQRVLGRLRALASERSFLLSLGGIVLLAFAVNLIELLCSAGIPAVYTQVLAYNRLPAWQYYAYLVLYILVFMLDDLIVFFSAMATLQVTGLGTRYVRWSHLIGGVLLLAIGALLWLRPDLLMFG